MFYTKYRPGKFSEIIGLEAVTTALLNELAAGKVAHAYFFAGPRGTGKTSMARILAKSLNCLKRAKNGEPCSQCANCLAITQDNFLDLIEIDAASNRGIDDIRSLRDKVKLAPTRGKYKIYIIDEVHMLTTEAFNALLKTLEEPPEKVVFILCTTDPQKVPATIKSRCQRFSFHRAQLGDLVRKLDLIAKKEKVEISAGDLAKIAKASAGGFRDAETLLEQMVIGGLAVSELLEASSEESFGKMTDLLSREQTAEALALVNKLFSEGVSLDHWLGGFLEYLRKLLLIQTGLGEELVDATSEQFKIMVEQAKILGPSLPRYLRIFSQALLGSKEAFIPQLPLEMAIVELAPARYLPASTGEACRAGRQSETVGLGVAGGSTEGEEKAEGVEDETILKLVQEKWGEILKALRSYNHSLEAVLRSCHPLRCTASKLILSASYEFHQKQLETARNRQLLEKVIQEILGRPLKVSCLLSPKAMTSKERLTQSPASALEAFNGDL